LQRFYFAIYLIKCWTSEFVGDCIFSLPARRVDRSVRVATKQGAIIKQPAVHTLTKVFLDLTNLNRPLRRLVMGRALNTRPRSAIIAVDLAITPRHRNRPFKLSQRT